MEGIMKIWYTVCYDISNDKARKKIEKLCSTYMQRIQYSVFEGYLSDTDYTTLYKKLQEKCREIKWNPATDSILIYRHCAVCYAEKVVLGKTISSSKSYLVI